MVVLRGPCAFEVQIISCRSVPLTLKTVCHFRENILMLIVHHSSFHASHNVQRDMKFAVEMCVSGFDAIANCCCDSFLKLCTA